MNRPERAGVALGAMVSAAVLPAAVAPAVLRPAPAVAPAVLRPAPAAPQATARARQATVAPSQATARTPQATARAPQATVAAAGCWRLVAGDHFGAPSNASGYSAVLAPGRHDAWVFGGTNPGGVSTPVAEHWNGHRWRTARLPGGLASFISGASASAPGDIWAVSSFGGYALHWNGARWSVARRWHPGPDAASATAISPADVWLFGTPRPGGHGAVSWNYNGRSWTPVAGPDSPVLRASAVSRRDILAITAAPGGGLVEQWRGTAWKRVRTGSVLAGTQLDDVLAVSRHSVWILGNAPAQSPAGHVVLAHWNGRKWRRIEAPGRAMPRRLAADGHGGVWVTATTLGARTESRLLHLSRSGRWTQVDIAYGLGNAISDLVLVPGSGALWGSGGFLTQAGGDTAIWRCAPRPALQPARRVLLSRGG